MRRREKTVLEGGKVAFEAIEGQWGGEGLFGLEDKADEVARHAKLRSLAEQIALYDVGMRAGSAAVLAVGKCSGIRGRQAESWSLIVAR